MPEAKITRSQLTRLQTLWAQYARHELVDGSRAARLRWASDQVKRTITSFADLTLSEASTLINILQGAMGIAETSPSARPRRYRSRINDKDQAHAAGTEGRRGNDKTLTPATAEDLAMIDAQLSAMEWDRARLDKFLESPSSPLGKGRRSNPRLLTVKDVNRVLWALKGIAARQAKQEVNA